MIFSNFERSRYSPCRIRRPIDTMCLCLMYGPQSIRRSKMSWCYNFTGTWSVLHRIRLLILHILQNSHRIFNIAIENPCSVHGPKKTHTHLHPRTWTRTEALDVCTRTMNQQRQRQLAHGEIWNDNNIQSTMEDVTGKRNEFRWQRKCTRGPYRLRVYLRDCNTVLYLLRAERIRIQTPPTVTSNRKKLKKSRPNSCN